MQYAGRHHESLQTCSFFDPMPGGGSCSRSCCCPATSAQAPIHKQGHQGVPLIFDIGERLAYRTLGRIKLSVYPGLELLVKRFQILLPPDFSLVRGHSRRLFPLQLIYLVKKLKGIGCTLRVIALSLKKLPTGVGHTAEPVDILAFSYSVVRLSLRWIL